MNLPTADWSKKSPNGWQRSGTAGGKVQRRLRRLQMLNSERFPQFRSLVLDMGFQSIGTPVPPGNGPNQPLLQHSDSGKLLTEGNR